jgi:hypothetical protein
VCLMWTSGWSVEHGRLSAAGHDTHHWQAREAHTTARTAGGCLGVELVAAARNQLDPQMLHVCVRVPGPVCVARAVLLQLVCLQLFPLSGGHAHPSNSTCTRTFIDVAPVLKRASPQKMRSDFMMIASHMTVHLLAVKQLKCTGNSPHAHTVLEAQPLTCCLLLAPAISAAYAATVTKACAHAMCTDKLKAQPAVAQHIRQRDTTNNKGSNGWRLTVLRAGQHDTHV